MSRPILVLMLVLGVLFVLGGAYRLIEDSIGLSECAQSPIPSSCGPNPEVVHWLFVYPLMGVGFVLIVSSLLMAWRQKCNRDDP